MSTNPLSKVLVGVLFALLLFSFAVGKVTSAEHHDSEHDSVTYTLVRESLTNVDDMAGLWQHEGGQVWLDGVQIGNYLIYRRVTIGGTGAQNTASVSMTIFYLGQAPPENITLQGSHDFGSGKYIGSVSAASREERHFLGDSFEGDTSTHQLTLRRDEEEER